jgi:hypothetical protein
MFSGTQLSTTDWSFIYALDNLDLDAEFEIFNFLIAALYECNVPLFEGSIDPRHKP